MLNLLRKFKASLKNHVILESHEKLSQFWKEELMSPIKNIYKEENRNIQCGVMFDPSEFIPHYLKRFVMKQEKAGNPLAPGHYSIVLKVFYSLCVPPGL